MANFASDAIFRHIEECFIYDGGGSLQALSGRPWKETYALMCLPCTRRQRSPLCSTVCTPTNDTQPPFWFLSIILLWC